jgi:hypothetical protein
MTTVSTVQALELRPALRGIARYDAIRIVLGYVLLTAAALKGYQLATEPAVNRNLFTSRWFLILVVEFEIAFALVFLSGLHKRLTWWLAAVGCFGLFFRW